MDNNRIAEEIKEVDADIAELRMSVIVPREKVEGIIDRLTRYRAALSEQGTPLYQLVYVTSDGETFPGKKLLPSQEAAEAYKNRFVAGTISGHSLPLDMGAQVLCLELYPVSTLFPNDKEKPKEDEHMEPQEPYCLDCGSDDLGSLGKKSNGTHWQCNTCKSEFIW